MTRFIYKIRLDLRSFDKNCLDECCSLISTFVKKYQLEGFGPIHFPTKRRIYCVLRSPHVDKDSREHFEIRLYKRIFDIYFACTRRVNPNDITQLFNKLRIPPGVFVNGNAK